MAEKSTFYKDNVPRIIKQYKIAFEQCLNIIGEEIASDLNDDKIYNALRGKEKAGEQAKFYAKEIELLENEFNGVHIVEKIEKTGAEKFTTQ